MYVIGTGTRWTPRRIARGVKRRIVPSPVSNRSDPPVEPPGPFDRRAVLLEGVRREMRILEIGASYSPLAPRKDGWNVRIVDHASREELVEKYSDPVHDVDVSRIEEVDVVWRGGPLDEAIGREHLGFDACVASHVVEHTPDLVGFLSGVMRSLAPDGWLSLAVPDMRYCFDLLRTPTRVGEVVVAHVNGAGRHGLATLVDQAAYSVAREGMIAWGQGDQGSLAFKGSLGTVPKLVAGHDDSPGSEYVDAHVWRFTPASFELLVLELSALGLIDAHIASIHDSVGCEFYVKLRSGRRLSPTPEEVDSARLALLERSVRELAEVWATVGT